jgi:hypothetical protein
MYGPNTDANCMLRVWAVNVSSTIMYAPLIMKLHRVDVLFRTLQRGGRRKIITDFRVGSQVVALLLVDILILVLYTILARPRQIVVNTLYSGAFENVQNRVCSTGLNEPFEIAMVAWKASLLAFGIFKAIRTWEVPEEISEAKYFAIAIYNIAVVGCFTYFLSVFGEADVNSVVVLRVIGLFISATVSAVVIMLPKLVIIQLSWTEVFLGSASSFKEDFSYTSSSPPIIIQPAGVSNTQKNGLGSRLNLDLNLGNMPVRKEVDEGKFYSVHKYFICLCIYSFCTVLLEYFVNYFRFLEFMILNPSCPFYFIRSYFCLLFTL